MAVVLYNEKKETRKTGRDYLQEIIAYTKAIPPTREGMREAGSVMAALAVEGNIGDFQLALYHVMVAQKEMERERKFGAEVGISSSSDDSGSSNTTSTSGSILWLLSMARKETLEDIGRQYSQIQYIDKITLERLLHVLSLEHGRREDPLFEDIAKANFDWNEVKTGMSILEDKLFPNGQLGCVIEAYRRFSLDIVKTTETLGTNNRDLSVEHMFISKITAALEVFKRRLIRINREHNVLPSAEFEQRMYNSHLHMQMPHLHAVLKLPVPDIMRTGRVIPRDVVAVAHPFSPTVPVSGI